MNVSEVGHTEVEESDFIYWLHSNDTMTENTILEGDKSPASTVVTDWQNRNDIKTDGFIPEMYLDRKYFVPKITFRPQSDWLGFVVNCHQMLYQERSWDIQQIMLSHNSEPVFWVFAKEGVFTC